MNSTKPPAGRILKGPRAFYFVPDNRRPAPGYKSDKPTGQTMPWRRLTLKVTKDATARTIRRNIARLDLARLLGKPELLQAPV